MFSIVVPVVSINAYVNECIAHLLELDESCWELIVVTDHKEKLEYADSRLRVISSGREGPGAKRDLAAMYARGRILVFLDDDSYPKADFLTILKRDFAEGHQVVGGPAVTPESDSFFQKVSGAVFLSALAGGAPHRVMPVGEIRKVIDWPTVNFSIERDLFLSMGGFDCAFWPGEDTFLCDKLTNNGYDITYDPAAIVWHHRRNTLRGHLRQIGSYGLHRGYFARKFPTSSRRVSYFLPSLLVLAFVVSVLATLLKMPFLEFMYGFWLIYLLSLMIAAVQISLRTTAAVAFMAVPYTVLTHFWYGTRFIIGFSKSGTLVSRLR